MTITGHTASPPNSDPAALESFSERRAQAVRDAQLAEVRDLLATILATMEDMLDGGLAVKSRGREIARLVADA